MREKEKSKKLISEKDMKNVEYFDWNSKKNWIKPKLSSDRPQYINSQVFLLTVIDSHVSFFPSSI